MNKLIIIDYFFKDNKGHDGRHDIAIAEEAIRQGIETVVMCPKFNSVYAPYFVRKSLHFQSRGRKGLFWYCVDAVSRFFELRGFWRKYNEDRKTVFFVSTIDDHFFISLFFSLLFISMRPKIVVMVRRGLNDYVVRSRGILAVIKINILLPLMRFVQRKKNVVLCSDSELIVENLVRRGFKNSFTAPIIVRVPDKKINFVKKEALIACVGGARFDKGFDVLPFIVEKMINMKVKFVIQTYMHDLEKNNAVVSAMKSLYAFAQAYPDKIELVDRPLSESEYASLLENCSIVVLPYRNMFYGAGISGIFAEAVSVGAWAVVPSDSWMAAQKEKYCKTVVVNNISADEIVSGICVCFEGQKINSAMVKRQILSWRRFHSAENFVSVLANLGVVK